MKDEVNRISKDTEYNSKSLLDGSLDTRVYTDNANVSRVNVSDYVNPGKYEINIKTAATKATDTATDVGINSTGTGAIGASGTISINGSSGTKVFVDNREIKLTGEMLIGYLRSLKSDDIARVEVLPSGGSR